MGAVSVIMDTIMRKADTGKVKAVRDDSKYLINFES